MKKYSLYIKILSVGMIVAAVQIFYGWGNLTDIGVGFLKSECNPYIFFTVMALGTPIGICPLSLCYLAAGMTFDFITAFALCLGGLAVSSSIGFLLGRFLGGERLKKILVKYLKSGAENQEDFILESRLKSGIYNLNFYIRAVPGVPYVFQNMILGAAGTNVIMYMVVTLVVQGTIAAFMILLGGSLAEGVNFLWIALLITILTVAHWLMRKFFVPPNVRLSKF